MTFEAERLVLRPQCEEHAANLCQYAEKTRPHLRHTIKADLGLTNERGPNRSRVAFDQIGLEKRGKNE